MDECYQRKLDYYMNATTLELFFIDGKPDGMLGMLIAEVFGWTGHSCSYYFSRKQFT